MIVEVSSKVPFWYPHDSRCELEVSTCRDSKGELEVPSGTLLIEEVSYIYNLVPE